MIKGKLPRGWELKTLGEVADNLDGSRVPLKMSDRDQRHGEYPYYGASGVIDHIDDFLFDGEYLGNRPIKTYQRTHFWVGQSVHAEVP